MNFNQYAFADIIELVSEKIKVQDLSKTNYISTENMLPNFGGVTAIDDLPNSNSCNKFSQKDVLFSNIRTYFKKVWFADFNGGCSPDVLVMRSKDENILLNKYLFLLIRSDEFINFTIISSNGAKMPRGDKNAMKKYIFNIPSIDYQKKCIEHYFVIDQKIQLNTQTNQTLEAIAQAIFKSWFVDFDPVRAKAQAILDGKTSDEANLSAMAIISGKVIEDLSQTEYQQLWEIADAFPSELVENAEFGEVPKGWEVRKIESIIKKIPTGKKYSQKTVQETGKVPVLDQGKSGLIGFHNDEAGVKANIENPVIVFANHTCYMRLISYDFSAIQNVFAFRGNELDIYWVYLATLGKQEFTEYKGHFPDFLIKEIIFPTTGLTTLFGNFIKYQFMNIFENDKQNKILSEMRDLLLPKLLSGELLNE